MLTDEQRHYHVKEWFSAKSEVENWTKVIDTHKPIILQDMEESGEKKFVYSDCKATYISGSAPKDVTDYKAAFEEILAMADKKGKVMKSEIARIKTKHTSRKPAGKPYLR